MKKLYFEFTLIELLVVISIIAILAALLLPALNTVKEKGRMIGCMGNLKQISTAIICYENDYDGWLPHSGMPTDVMSVSPRSWQYLLSSYLGVSNPTAYTLNHKVFQCPAQMNATCGDSSYGDDGFYGGYAWNYAYLGWRDVFFSGSVPWRKVSELKTPSTTISTGDTSDSVLAAMFYLQVWNLYDIGILHEATRHAKGGDYIWCDGHVSWKSAKDVWTNRTSWYRVP